MAECLLSVDAAAGDKREHAGVVVAVAVVVAADARAQRADVPRQVCESGVDALAGAVARRGGI